MEMNAQDVGKKLMERREERGLDLDAAAKVTHIRRHYLAALEEGNFGALPSAVQVKGFLASYAKYLDLDPEPLFVGLKPSHPEPIQTAEAQELETSPYRSESDHQAAAAFAELGQELRLRREQMQLYLSEVENYTRIPEHYVDRLERGEFDSFPSPTQARGMLANYADFLGMDSETLLLRYAEILQQRFKARAVEKPVKRVPVRPIVPKLKFTLPEWAQPFLTRDVAFGSAAAIGLILFVIFSVSRILATRAAEPAQPTAPPLVNLLLSSASPMAGTNTPTIGAAPSINLLQQQSATPGLLGQATIQATGSGNVAVRLLALQRTWMRITVDGRVEFEGRAEPGKAYEFHANGQVVLFTGNAAGLRVFFNEQDLGILGIYGEISQVVFSAQGIATPTLSPTPTINPEILTSTANAALTPSATPSPALTSTPTQGASGGPSP